jgi:hypothetical protein
MTEATTITEDQLDERLEAIEARLEAMLEDVLDICEAQGV